MQRNDSFLVNYVLKALHLSTTFLCVVITSSIIVCSGIVYYGRMVVCRFNVFSLLLKKKVLAFRVDLQKKNVFSGNNELNL